MSEPIAATRRVVTNADGADSGLSSEGTARIVRAGASGVEMAQLWRSDEEPVALDAADPMSGDWALEPGPGGFCWRTITFPPGVVGPMHRTNTMDLVTIISGQVILRLRDSERILGPGDCVVLRASTHLWETYGDKPCVMSAVMLGAG